MTRINLRFKFVHKPGRRKIGDEVAIRLRYRTGNVWTWAKLVGEYRVGTKATAWLAGPIDLCRPYTVYNADASCEGTGTTTHEGKTVYIVGSWDVATKRKAAWAR